MYPYCVSREEDDEAFERSKPAVVGSAGRRLAGANRNIRVVAYPTGLRVEDLELDALSRQPRPAAFLHRGAATKPHPIRPWYMSISAAAALLWRRMRDRRATRRAIAELEAMDDRALRDIGLTRFDLRRACRGDLDLR
jgi:uncharacterized protein YjiS (DUF1127 family)